MNRLESIAAQIDQRQQPPVHLWNPDHRGEIDMRIDSQGHWFHAGDPILRDELIRLFASILWYENGQYCLKTPVEHWAIDVEDVPFLVHQMERVDDAWVATTNMHEQIIIGQDHPVELRRYQEQWIPYIKIRYELWARVNRSIYYQWVEEAIQAQASEDAPLKLHSRGYEFEVART